MGIIAPASRGALVVLSAKPILANSNPGITRKELLLPGSRRTDGRRNLPTSQFLLASEQFGYNLSPAVGGKGKSGNNF